MANKLDDIFLDWAQFRVYLVSGVIFEEKIDIKHGVVKLRCTISGAGYRTLLFMPSSSAKGQSASASSDYTDYTSTFQTKANPPPANVLPNGTQAITIRDEKYSDLSSRIIGSGHMQILPNTTGILDFKITKELKIRGGDFWCSNASFGDTVDFEVIDRDDILGLFSTYGITQGTGYLSLSKPVDAISVPPFAEYTYSIAMGTEQDIKAGLYVRLKYVNASVANNVQCGLAILVRE